MFKLRHSNSWPLRRRGRTLCLPLLVINLAACVQDDGDSNPPSQSAENVAAQSKSLFSDVTSDSGLKFHHFNGMYGELLMPEMMGSGVAVIDYDNDGDLDLYFVQGAPYGNASSSPNPKGKAWVFEPRHDPPFSDRIYENRWYPDGELAFLDRTRDLLPEDTDQGMGVTTVDFNADGWMDLFLTRLGANRLLKNQAGSGFVDVSQKAGVGDAGWGTSAAACDLDSDGLNDLIVANYLEWSMERRVICTSSSGRADYCGPKAYAPASNRLYHNRGEGRFLEIGHRSGFSVKSGSSLGVVCADFNADGAIDIYVANDQMANELWINQGDLTFTDEAQLRGAAVNLDGLPEASMGVVTADFDQDGDRDLFMTHLVRESNTIYENDGSGYFLDRTQKSGMRSQSWMLTGFGVASGDFDANGWQDLYVANGAVMRIDERMARHDPHPLDEPDQLFMATEGLRFALYDLPIDSEKTEPGVGRGVALADLDNDGDLDLVISNNSGPARVLRNDLNPAIEQWSGLATAPGGAADALFMAQVELRTNSRSYYFRAAAGGSYLSAGDPRILIQFHAAESEARQIVLKALPQGRVATSFDPTSLSRGAYQPLPSQAALR